MVKRAAQGIVPATLLSQADSVLPPACGSDFSRGDRRGVLEAGGTGTVPATFL
jgi:hypothetical protein